MNDDDDMKNWQEDLHVGGKVLFRNMQKGTIFGIDDYTETFKVKVLNHMDLTYTFQGAHGMGGDWDIIALASSNPTEATDPKLSQEKGIESLPSWASYTAQQGVVKQGLQLLTKDGRISGNAVVVSVEYRPYEDGGKAYFHCISDAGNVSKLSYAELESRFYFGRYIMNEYPGYKGLAL